MRKIRFIKGESLTETVIALSILSVAITISSLVVSNATTNMAVSRNRVIAVNIAREGLEAIRNIRDTNWLKFSDSLRECWNHVPGANGTNGDLADDTCDGNEPIIPGEYVVYKNDEFGWKIDDAVQGITDATILYEVDIDDQVDTDNDGDSLNDPDIYNHITTVDGDALFYASMETAFSRKITIEYLENEPDPLTAPSNETEPLDTINTLSEWTSLGLAQPEVNRLLITSTVTWEEENRRGEVVHSVNLQTILTDYLGRSSISN